MKKYAGAASRDPRRIGLVCGLAAVALGIGYLLIADAPRAYFIVNACAAIIGVGCFYGLNKSGTQPARMHTAVWLGLAALLLATATFGVSVDGASRWIRLGSLYLQVSLIVVPAMLVVYAQHRNLLTTASIIMVAIALALQPDRAMAAVVMSALVLLAARMRDRQAIVAALIGVGSFAATLMRADALPAVPYVDQILYTAFDVNFAAGCAVIAGALLLIVPGIAGRSPNRWSLATYEVFALTWATVVAAAALGNYPTPVVGYGGTAIVGYFLSLGYLPRPSASTVSEAAAGTLPASAATDKTIQAQFGAEAALGSF